MNIPLQLLHCVINPFLCIVSIQQILMKYLPFLVFCCFLVPLLFPLVFRMLAILFGFYSSFSCLTLSLSIPPPPLSLLLNPQESSLSINSRLVPYLQPYYHVYFPHNYSWLISSSFNPVVKSYLIHFQNYIVALQFFPSLSLFSFLYDVFGIASFLSLFSNIIPCCSL